MFETGVLVSKPICMARVVVRILKQVLTRQQGSEFHVDFIVHQD